MHWEHCEAESIVFAVALKFVNVKAATLDKKEKNTVRKNVPCAETKVLPGS